MSWIVTSHWFWNYTFCAILCNVYPCVHSVQKSMYLDIHSCIYLGTLTFVAYTVEVNRGLVCKGTKAVRTRSGFGLAAPSGPRRINAFLTLSNFTSNSPQIVNFYQRFNQNCQLFLSIKPIFLNFTNDSPLNCQISFKSPQIVNLSNCQILPSIPPISTSKWEFQGKVLPLPSIVKHALEMVNFYFHFIINCQFLPTSSHISFWLD